MNDEKKDVFAVDGKKPSKEELGRLKEDIENYLDEQEKRMSMELGEEFRSRMRNLCLWASLHPEQFEESVHRFSREFSEEKFDKLMRAFLKKYESTEEYERAKKLYDWFMFGKGNIRDI